MESLERSFVSSVIAITMYSYFYVTLIKIFLTTCWPDIISPWFLISLAIFITLVQYSSTFSDSIIFKFWNSLQRVWRFIARTFLSPYTSVSKESQVTFAVSQVAFLSKYALETYFWILLKSFASWRYLASRFFISTVVRSPSLSGSSKPFATIVHKPSSFKCVLILIFQYSKSVHQKMEYEQLKNQHLHFFGCQIFSSPNLILRTKPTLDTNL